MYIWSSGVPSVRQVRVLEPLKVLRQATTHTRFRSSTHSSKK
ncbi:MAG TPA: hypothetical protein VM287_09985 [Egibacteraceae bacterium]|nr:hypothetical protein [Egibacteraceae bacterium]